MCLVETIFKLLSGNINDLPLKQVWDVYKICFCFSKKATGMHRNGVLPPSCSEVAPLCSVHLVAGWCVFIAVLDGCSGTGFVLTSCPQPVFCAENSSLALLLGLWVSVASHNFMSKLETLSPTALRFSKKSSLFPSILPDTVLFSPSFLCASGVKKPPKTS